MYNFIDFNINIAHKKFIGNGIVDTKLKMSF